MKKVIVVIFSLFVLTGCFEKDPQPRGTATALLNGKTWRAERIYVYQSPYAKDHIDFSFERGKASLITEGLLFLAYPSEPGMFDVHKIGTIRESIQNRKSSYFYISDHDVLSYSFEVLETPRSGAENAPSSPEDKNHFTITSIKGNEIQGTFQVVLVREKRSDYENLPENLSDTLRFTEGKFRVYLED